MLMLAGCKKNASTKVVNSKHVRVGFIGLTCEAPIYTAYEKGFFKDEGLEPELVKCSWAQYKDNLALGSYDITHHLVMYFLKPIEQGLDVRFLGGVHTGCLRVQTGVNSRIHTIQDLKGKSIGVPGMGTPPFVFANRVCAECRNPIRGIADPCRIAEERIDTSGRIGATGEVAKERQYSIGGVPVADDITRKRAGA